MRDDGPTASEIAALLNDQAESLIKVILPGGTFAGGYYNIGSVRGDSGDSLKVKITRSPRGSWADYACSKGDPEGTGDMLKLVKLTVAEGDMGRALKWARGWLGIESMDPRALERQKKRAEAAQRRHEAERMNRVEKSQLRARGMWHNGVPIIGTPAIRYLEGRGIDFAQIGRISGALRYCHNVWHPEYGRPIPALLTAGTALSGQHVCTHATFLDRQADGNWGKLPDWTDPGTGKRVKVAKKIFGQDWLGSHFSVNKGANRVPMRDMARGEAVAISEGLEDALTMAMLHPQLRVVMAGTQGNVGELVVPPQCGDVIMVAQRDPEGSKPAKKFEDMLAAQQARAVAQNSPRRVMNLWPGQGYKDINDELRGVRIDA
jgi:hypothetical protein